MDSGFCARCLRTTTEVTRDQYADGKVATFINESTSRTSDFKTFLLEFLRKNGCKRILDAACGTGVDSILLLEEGFDVISTDASNEMLKYATKVRWNRRKEPAFDKWIIEEANWLTLNNDIEHLIGDGFDAVICLGNSFAHVMDSTGDQREQKQAMGNLRKCLKPGGFLLIDHRNYDAMIDKNFSTPHSIYYTSKHPFHATSSILSINGKPTMLSMDFSEDVTSNMSKTEKLRAGEYGGIRRFRLTVYPHRLESFKRLLKDVFGDNSVYKVYGDFKELKENEEPAFYMHIVQRSLV